MIRISPLAASAVLGFSCAAIAADLPSRKSPPPAPVYYNPAPVASWTGFYLGEELGYGWTTDAIRQTTLPGGALLTTSGINASGPTLVAFGGYNWQLGNNFVVGAEVDFGSAWIGGATTQFTPALANARVAEWMNAESSVRLRLGYAINDNVLVYGTGGVAFGAFGRKYVGSGAPIPGIDRFQGWQTGWTLGAGAEYMINPSWTARLEYRYSQFPRFRDTPVNSTTLVGSRFSHQINENEIRVGVAYRFGNLFAAPAPIAAKY